MRTETRPKTTPKNLNQKANPMRTAFTLGATLALTLVAGAVSAAPASDAVAAPDATPANAAAVTIPPRALSLLGAIDVPLTPALMAEVGLTPAVAAAVLRAPNLQRYPRMRALWALSQHAGPDARALVIAAADEDADVEVRAEAALVLARAFALHGDAVARQALDRLAEANAGKVSGLAQAERLRLDARPALPTPAVVAPQVSH